MRRTLPTLTISSLRGTWIATACMTHHENDDDDDDDVDEDNDDDDNERLMTTTGMVHDLAFAVLQIFSKPA